jgi:hypothetical protein
VADAISSTAAAISFFIETSFASEPLYSTGGKASLVSSRQAQLFLRCDVVSSRAKSYKGSIGIGA